MKYRKYETGAYHLHLINTDKFKTITIRINFKQKVAKEDITYRTLLAKVLLESNEHYQNRRELEIQSEELYNASVGIDNTLSGNYIVTTFQGTFLNELYTEPGMNQASIRFLLDILFCPKIENEQFTSTAFERAKKMVQEDIDTLKENPGGYGTVRLLETMAPKEIISYRMMGYEEDLNQITSKQLYEYYQNLLKKDIVDIFVIGSVDEDRMKSIFSEEFKINTAKKPPKDHFYQHKTIHSRSKNLIEEEDLEQSHLYLGFKLDQLTDFERQYVMNIYSFILGGGPSSKLFMDVREKNSLCYFISSRFFPLTNTMIIHAGINASEYKKAVRLIKKEIKLMETGSFEEDDIHAAKITYVTSFKELEDSPQAIVTTFVSHEYFHFGLLDERAKEIVRVTKQDIVKVAKKIHLDTVYLLKGAEKHD